MWECHQRDLINDQQYTELRCLRNGHAQGKKLLAFLQDGGRASFLGFAIILLERWPEGSMKNEMSLLLIESGMLYESMRPLQGV